MHRLPRPTRMAMQTWLGQPRCQPRSRGLVGDAQRSTPSSSAPLTQVEKILLGSIKASGPQSFATYMQLCLTHPVHGYYTDPAHAVFGARGDFTTSPEISQAFGELVAVWMLEQWMATAPARPFRVVELGPGRGTLMDDMLRVFRQFPAARARLAEVHLVESSPAMTALQASKLRPTAEDGWRPALAWHTALGDVPRTGDTYTMVVAHEFFDALPVHVIERTSRGWHEVLVTLAQDPAIGHGVPSAQAQAPPSAADAAAMSPRWARVLSPAPTASATLLGGVSPRFSKLPVGSRVEISSAGVKTARAIADLVGGDEERGAGGCALVVDYGAEHAFGDSLRAFKDHRIVDVFHRPGECDITANVDFALLKESLGEHVTPLGTLRQGTFLNRLGLQLRAASLMRAAPSPERKRAIEEGVSRLVDPLGMGGQYAVLGITSRRKGASHGQGVWPFMDVDDAGAGVQPG